MSIWSLQRLLAFSDSILLRRLKRPREFAASNGSGLWRVGVEVTVIRREQRRSLAAVRQGSRGHRLGSTEQIRQVLLHLHLVITDRCARVSPPFAK